MPETVLISVGKVQVYPSLTPPAKASSMCSSNLKCRRRVYAKCEKYQRMSLCSCAKKIYLKQDTEITNLKEKVDPTLKDTMKRVRE